MIAAPAWRAIADVAALGPATAVLDVGCGAGGFCAVAAAAGATVSGIDHDANALAAAHRQAPSADLRLGVMEALPWEDDHFDVVVGINAFQYAADTLAALSEARRVARPGGTVVICKWGTPDESDLLALLQRLTGRRAATADAFATLAPAVAQAGLVEQARDAVTVVLDVPDLETLTTRLQRAGARIGHDAVRRAAAPFATPAGGYRLRNRYRYLVAGA
ncbi:MAG TPA: class I SAM-dependent methyltransferase [Solirubrobacteraceae bacterium]